jgi:uncharacterized coiled-coil DUF342 family protein
LTLKRNIDSVTASIDALNLEIAELELREEHNPTILNQIVDIKEQYNNIEKKYHSI